MHQEQIDPKHPHTAGVFNFSKDKYYKIIFDDDENISMQESTKVREIYEDSEIPLWIIRHSLGVEGGEEDYTSFHERKLLDEYDYYSEREYELRKSILEDGSIRNLSYRGIQIDVPSNSYSHAVGPIHAGVIEPGHFRFSVTGEVIQHLTIRLGFQHRGIYKLIHKKTPLKVLPFAEAISSDSAVAYSMAFNRIYEKSAGIEISEDIRLFRLVLLELERIAIHIGDLGALAGDIGYYPLLGLCSTDRGAPLGVMEALVGSRFGKSAIFPGETVPRPDLNPEKLKTLASNLMTAFKRVEVQFLRAANNSTIRERLQDCGTLSRKIVKLNGFVGMVARSSGLHHDLRKKEDLYNKYGKIDLIHEDSDLHGDAWSRFYLRYLELKQSVLWVCEVLPALKVDSLSSNQFKITKIKNFKRGIYLEAVEGWRGPVLVVLELNERGEIENSYIRDPSVPNWHALEMAVRGELIGDFPLNNKSFNLSYAGFDL